MDNLESRIRALEASNRRQRYSITALAAIILGGAFIVMTRPAGDATFDTVTCKAWKLVDTDGKTRMSAVTTANGHADMSWFDKDGETRILAGTYATGDAAMAWFDKDGETRMVANTDANGDADMSWFDKDGTMRIVAGTYVDGIAVAWWFDKDGELRIKTGTDAENAVMLPTIDLKPKT